jgi:hypothetical protein
MMRFYVGNESRFMYQAANCDCQQRQKDCRAEDLNASAHEG